MWQLGHRGCLLRRLANRLGLVHFEGVVHWDHLRVLQQVGPLLLEGLMRRLLPIHRRHLCQFDVHLLFLHT